MTSESDPRLNSTCVPGAGAEEPASVLVRVMEECLIRLEAGEPLDAAAVTAAHPELASQIEACLASLQWIHRAVQPEGVPQRLADFRIVREIGRGGMGVVYEAEQVSLRRPVALKVLRWGGVADPEALLRFQREAQTVAALHHTNIVPIFAVGAEDNVHYYAMQLIAGRSLRDLLLDAPDPIPDRTVAGWGLQAAEALAHAHERNVVHRDVKPSNLILGTDGRIWLTDFGLAKRLDDVTLSLCGALLGTPRYMSPEQASAMTHPVDHRTDIYSLGATLYELVTRRPVFESELPHVVISQILTMEPRPPRAWSPGLSRDLETIILKCLSKDAGQRYATARELADDLRAVTEGRSIRARRDTVWEQAIRWTRRHRRSLTTTVGAIVMTCAILLGSTWVLRMQQISRLAQVQVKTDRGPLTAEILTTAGHAATAPFTIPNEQPIEVPEGDYQFRVTGNGEFGPTALWSLPRGSRRPLTVDAGASLMSPAVPISSVAAYEIVDFGEGPDVLALPASPSPPDSASPAARAQFLRRISGRTGKELWSLDISRDSPELGEVLKSDAERTHWWQSTVFGWKQIKQMPPRVLRPLPDLDADGVPDLIWCHLDRRSLFAVSGKTGLPLWWQPSVADGSRESVRFGDILLSQVDTPQGTREPVLALIESERAPDGKTLRSKLIIRRGRDLTMLWNHDLPAGQVRLAVSPLSSRQSSIAVVVTDQEIRSYSLQTGQPIGAAQSIAMEQASLPGLVVEYTVPRVVDLDGDGLWEVLLVRTEPGAPPLGIQVVPLQLEAGGLTANRPQWMTPFAGDQPAKTYTVDLVDLNGDGLDEVLVGSERYEFDCRVLDGRTGQERWRQRRRSHIHSGRHSLPVLGDDLNGDGWRETFSVVAEPGGRAGPFDDRTVITAECFSGRDGTSLWWSQYEVPAKVNVFQNPFAVAPVWWKRGLQGGPMLLVTALLEADAFEPRCLVLALDGVSGSIQRIGTGLAGAQATDLDQDGIDELMLVRLAKDGQSAHDVIDSPAQLCLFRGTSPEVWQRVGHWQPLMDLDGDGHRELWQPNHRNGNQIPLISGVDGRLLKSWQLNSDLETLLPFPSGGAPGDAQSDLLALNRSSTWVGEGMPVEVPLGVQRLEGRRGQVRWKSSSIRRPEWSPLNLLERTIGTVQLIDLDGDQTPEVLVPYHWFAPQMAQTAARSQMCLACVSSQTGALLWRTVLLESAELPVSWRGGAGWMGGIQTGDLDADGHVDLVVPLSAVPWHDRPPREAIIKVLRGRDGTALWPDDHARFHQPQQGLESVLEVAVADVDGRPGDELIRLDFVAQGGQLSGNEIAGQWQLDVLGGADGAVKFHVEWESSLPPHGQRAALTRLQALRGGDPVRILVTKAKMTPHRPDLPGEDWFFELEKNGSGLRQAERRTAHRDDATWVLDLDSDGRDEAVTWRRLADASTELVAVRSGHEILWSFSMPPLQGIAHPRLSLQDRGRYLFVETGREVLILDAAGQLQRRFPATGPGGLAEVSLSECWSRGAAAHWVVVDGDFTRCELLAAPGRSIPPRTIVPSAGVDPRLRIELPWVRQPQWLAESLRLLIVGLAICLLGLAPGGVILSWLRQGRRPGLARGLLVLLLPACGLWLLLPFVRFAFSGHVPRSAIAWLFGSAGLVALGYFQVGVAVRQRGRRGVAGFAIVVLLTSLVLSVSWLGFDFVGRHAAEAYRFGGWPLILLPSLCLGLMLLGLYRLLLTGLKLLRGVVWPRRPGATGHRKKADETITG